MIVFLKENVITYESVELDEVTDSFEAASNPEVALESITSSDALLKSTDSTEEVPSQKEDEVPVKKSKLQTLFHHMKQKSKNRKGRGSLKILKDPNVLKTCIMYAILGFYQTIFDEVLPLLMLAGSFSFFIDFLDVSKGGLDFSTTSIGIAGAFGGLTIVTVQAFIYHRVANKLKLVRTFRLGTLLTIPVYLLLPCMHYRVKNNLKVSLSLFDMEKLLFGQVCYF